MKNLYYKYRNFILYVAIGTLAVIIDTTIFLALNEVFYVHYVISNIISVFIGILISFYFNSRYNFKKTDRTVKRFIFFSCVCLIGMGFGSSLLIVFYETFNIMKIAAKILSVIFAGIFQYAVNKYFTFK